MSSKQTGPPRVADDMARRRGGAAHEEPPIHTGPQAVARGSRVARAVLPFKRIAPAARAISKYCYGLGSFGLLRLRFPELWV
jgi:hypothetical protein